MSFQDFSLFENAEVRFSLPAEIISQIPSGEAIPPSSSRGSPKMFAVCVGIANDVKHFHVGATLPEWSRFPELKDFCKTARAARFVDYEVKITAATVILKGFLAEEEKKEKAQLEYVDYTV